MPKGEVMSTITVTSIATALFLGVATYAICNFVEKRFGDKEAAPEVAEEPAPEAEENK